MNETLVIEAVRKTVTVDCSVEEAFRVFTAGADSWWPVETHSIHGTNAQQVVFETHEGGRVFEVGPSGEHGHWATVVSWDPPNGFVLAWNILEREAVPTEVEVRFLPDGGSTRVDLEHRGWDAIAEDAAEKRGNYDTGWDGVLARYVAGAR